MIYQVKKDKTTLQIDDTIPYESQSSKFKKLFEELCYTEQKGTDESGKEITKRIPADAALFDNCKINVLENGRLIIVYL